MRHVLLAVCAANYYKDAGLCKPCTGGGSTEDENEAETCSCANADTELYDTSIVYDTKFGCGEPAAPLPVPPASSPGSFE